MTQNGSNGSQQPKPEDLEIYEPVFINEEEESAGWFATDIKGEEGEIIPDSELPREIKPDEPDER